MLDMTEEQAYAAMFRFLERRYDRLRSDELAGLLGELALLADGSPADPAVREEWRWAVEYAVAGGKPASLKLRKPPGECGKDTGS
jgi:hypothetical protein